MNKTQLLTLTFVLSFAVACPVGQADETYIDSSDLTATRAKRDFENTRIFTKTKNTRRQKSTTPKLAKSSKSGFSKSSIAYPTGKISTSSLLLEKMYPSVVKMGQPYEYTIKATNLTSLNLQNVSINEQIPEGFELISAEPKITTQSGQNAAWDLGTLDPNESVLIKLRGKAASKAQLPCCTSADYSNPALCSTSEIVSPAIQISLRAPKKITVCQRIPLEYTIKNTGDSYLSDVQVSASLPKGVVNLNGGKEINLKAGNLSAGESKRVVAYAQPKQTGSYQFTGEATSSDALASAGKQTTQVVQPSIAVTASVDREKVYVGRPLTYDFKVTNNGKTDAELTMLQAKLSPGSDIQSASSSGRISGNNVQWQIGTLKPGATQSYSVKANNDLAGSARAKATANATCADAATDTAQSLVAGIPALLLEVVDLTDPVELNGAETYVVTVTNQGSATANNIKINAMMEGMKYTSDTGATKGKISGNTLSFNSLPTLEPKERAQWNINVSGAKTGDLRFKVTMDSDELTRSVEETESTFVY